MLRELRIENFVLARQVELSLEPGLNLITGETGAGKSLLVDALSVVLGARGESSFVRQGTDRAHVEALFDVSKRPDVVERLARAGLDAPGGELLLRREIGADGRSRAFVGSSPVTVGMLREMSAGLVELHGQHEPQSLFQPELHRQLLDRFGGHEEELAAVRRSALALRDLDQQLAELRTSSELREGRIELLRFRLAEFERVAPTPDEEDELRRERERLRHAESIAEATSAALETLYEEEGAALDRVHQASRRVRAQAAHDASYGELAERLDDVRAQLQEIALDLREAGESLSGDPGRLAEIEERLVAIERLRRRFENAPLADVVSSAAEMRRELERLEGQGSSAEELEEKRGKLLAEYARHAGALRARRIEAGAQLGDDVSALLSDLAMPNARLGIELREKSPEEAIADASAVHGTEEVELMLQANPGEPARPLRKVASGGEISRVMLALDIALEAGLPHRVLLFDEVDQGLGGEAAERLGDFLRRASRGHQVICVTHLPQVAARADMHVHVSKKQRSGRTVAVVKVLDKEYERAEELARMLGGSIVTDTARQHAEALLRAELDKREQAAPPDAGRSGGSAGGKRRKSAR